MISPAALEEAILCILCYSSEHAPILALRLTDSKLFSNRTNKTLGLAALDYISKYSRPPGSQLEYLLEADLRRGEEGKLLRQQIDFMAKRVSEIDITFVLEELDNFIENQKLSHSLQSALELLQEGDLTKAKELIYKSSSSSVKVSEGLWMKDPSQALSFFNEEDSAEFFSSGIEVLDHRGVRPERKTLTFLIAAAKKGKSWFLIEVGKAGLQHHHKVLHVTLEISAEKTARRYIQSLFSLTKDQAKQIRVPFFQKDSTGGTIIQFAELQRDSVIAKRLEVQTKLSGMLSYPDWVIKEFPTSILSVEQLDVYIDSLQRDRGFIPDLLIIDYADLMKIDTAALRIDTGRLYRELRGLAVTRNLALATATQGNRDSEDAKVVGKKNVSEDWSKVGTADTILTYSQTSAEKALGLARLFVAGSRDAEDQFIALISQAYPIGQFAIDSVLMNSDILTQIQAM